MGDVRVFSHYQLVGDFLTIVDVIKQDRRARPNAVGRKPGNIDHRTIRKTFPQIADSRSHIVLAVARGGIFRVLGEITHSHGNFEVLRNLGPQFCFQKP